MKNRCKSHTAVNYRIRVKGHLGNNWSDWFEGLDVSIEDGETILRGELADQAALHGLLIRIRDLNLTLLAVEQIEPEPGERS
jgi:hypothetical protein